MYNKYTETKIGKREKYWKKARLLPKERKHKMDENKTNQNAPKNNKRSLGLLIMILALVLVAVVLVIVIVASSGDSETTTTANTTTTPQTSTTVSTTTKTPNTTTTPTTSTTAVTTTKTPVTVVLAIAETTGKADEGGKVSPTSADNKTGSLILIGSSSPYAYDVENIFKGGSDLSTDDVTKAGFVRISTKFYTPSNDEFLRKEAFDSLVKMITAFEAVSGTSGTFRVDGYSSSNKDDLTANWITGNAFSMLIMADNKTDTYGFNYSAKKVTVDGSTMTYEEWFEANAAKFGFCYEGLIGTNENHKSGKFRYVGTIHAAGVVAAEGLDKYLAGVKAGTITKVTAADGTVWNLSYVEASSEEKTEITVGANATYYISGDNLGGFVVAVKAPSAS